MDHAGRWSRSQGFGQLAAAPDPAHQRHPAGRAVGGAAGGRDHQFAGHPHPLGWAGDLHLPHHRGLDADPVQRGLPGVRPRGAGVAVHDPVRPDPRPPVATAGPVRGGRLDLRSRVVDHRHRPGRTAVAFRPERPPAHPAVAIPRRPALDRHARRGAHRVGPVAARALAALVVDAAAGLHSDPPRGQRRRAGPLTAGPGGRLVRRWAGGLGQRHPRVGGTAGRRGARDGQTRVRGRGTAGGPPRRVGAAGAVGRHR